MLNWIDVIGHAKRLVFTISLKGSMNMLLGGECCLEQNGSGFGSGNSFTLYSDNGFELSFYKDMICEYCSINEDGQYEIELSYNEVRYELLVE